MDNRFVDKKQKYGTDYQRISCWVYLEKNKQPEVFYFEKPNTKQIYIDFYEMNHYFWNMIESECVMQEEGMNKHDKIVVYNNRKIKQFVLKYLVKDWSFQKLERQEDGSLTKQSLRKIYALHPRILKNIINQYVYRAGFTEEEDGKIQKQCYLLFDKGQGVSNPHWAVSLYLDLTAFWDKFGLNYYDIQKLPQQVYDGLRKVMGAQNSITAMKYAKSSKSSSGGGRGTQTKQIRF